MERHRSRLDSIITATPENLRLSEWNDTPTSRPEVRCTPRFPMILLVSPEGTEYPFDANAQEEKDVCIDLAGNTSDQNGLKDLPMLRKVLNEYNRWRGSWLLYPAALLWEIYAKTVWNCTCCVAKLLIGDETTHRLGCKILDVAECSLVCVESPCKCICKVLNMLVSNVKFIWNCMCSMCCICYYLRRIMH